VQPPGCVRLTVAVPTATVPDAGFPGLVYNAAVMRILFPQLIGEEVATPVLGSMETICGELELHTTEWVRSFDSGGWT